MLPMCGNTGVVLCQRGDAMISHECGVFPSGKLPLECEHSLGRLSFYMLTNQCIFSWKDPFQQRV